MFTKAWAFAPTLMVACLGLMPTASAQAESVLSAPASASVSYAGAFLATQSFRIQSVVFPGVFQQSSPSSFDLAIYGSAQGLPGSSLGGVSNLTGGTTVVNLSSLSLSVAAGQTYWLVLSPNGITAAATSSASSTVPLSVTADSTSGVVSAVVNAVNEIPEPSTAALALVALAGLGFARRLRTR